MMLFAPTVRADSLKKLISCTWMIAGHAPMSKTTLDAVVATGGVAPLRRLFWDNIGTVSGKPQEFKTETEPFDIVDYYSKALLETFPESRRFRLVRQVIPETGERIPIALMVNYQTPFLNHVPLEGRILKNQPADPHWLLYSLEETVLPDPKLDVDLRIHVLLALLNEEGPLFQYSGGYVSLPIGSLLVHWNRLRKLEFVLPKDLQIPTAGSTFPPTNNYTGEVVQHAVRRRLVRRGEKAAVMGAGGGGDSIALARLGMHVTAVDKDPWSRASVAMAAHLTGTREQITFVESNLFEKVTGKYSLILFVAPYPTFEAQWLPDWRTYQRGFDLNNQFMIGSPYHLTDDGSIVLLSIAEFQRAPQWLDMIHVNEFLEETFDGQKVTHSTYHLRMNDMGRLISSLHP